MALFGQKLDTRQETQGTMLGLAKNAGKPTSGELAAVGAVAQFT